MDEKIESLIKSWEKRNIGGWYCRNKKEGVEKLLEFIPASASVGFSGSKTLEELGIIKLLESRGHKVFNPNQSCLSRPESLELRRQGAQADLYLASANAISEKGELVFFSAYGNRIAGVAYARKVIVVCGTNKLASHLEEALKRAREHATPLNCRRLNWETPCVKDGICLSEICLGPDYKRMCCQILVIEAEIEPGRLQVVLVDEALGF
ncbi:MAG: lactate utilization protein [Candidatus Omnitrophota bacterium]